MTQAQLAEAVDVSSRTVVAWEGDERTPQGDNLIRLAAALRVTPEWIMRGGEKGVPTEEPPSDVRDHFLRRDGDLYVVPTDDAGVPLEDELEELRSWLPDEAQRRMSRHVTERVWLGALYAHGTDEGWTKERLDRIDAARRRVDELRQAEDS